MKRLTVKEIEAKGWLKKQLEIQGERPFGEFT